MESVLHLEFDIGWETYCDCEQLQLLLYVASFSLPDSSMSTTFSLGMKLVQLMQKPFFFFFFWKSYWEWKLLISLSCFFFTLKVKHYNEKLNVCFIIYLSCAQWWEDKHLAWGSLPMNQPYACSSHCWKIAYHLFWSVLFYRLTDWSQTHWVLLGVLHQHEIDMFLQWQIKKAIISAESSVKEFIFGSKK